MSLVYGQTSEKTKSVKQLVDQLAELGKSEEILIGDVRALLFEVESSYADVDDVFVSAARKILSAVEKDGVVSAEEKALLSRFADLFENPVSECPVESVFGKSFVLTGDFSVDGGKATVEKMIAAAGGFVKGSVSGKTDYVVVGEQGSPAWGYGSFGGKIKKALDLMLTGKGKVKIVSEAAFLSHAQESGGQAAQALREQQERFEQQRTSVEVVSRNFQGLTEGQQRVMDLVDAGKNVYLTGLGGTGKSYVIRKIIAKASESGKNVITCAPTGIAALNIGGTTIHRALGIRPERTLEMNVRPWLAPDSPLLSCDLMIVDEISMCRMDLFDYLSTALKIASRLRAQEGKAPCQLVVVGDFCQLPPVLPKAERGILEQKYGYDVGGGYPFMGTEWDSWAFEGVELTKAIRQRDRTFVAALNACRVGDTSGLRWIEEHARRSVPEHAIILCGRNDMANRENKRNLDALPGKASVYRAGVTGTVENGDKPTLDELELKPGARVMALVNDPLGTFMNGSLGTVLACGKAYVDVQFDSGGTVSVTRHTWEVVRPMLSQGKTEYETIGTFKQIPLKLAYAITIHKSQGQTFDAASIYPDCWDPGQLYTALSRLTSIEGLHLARHCSDSFLKTSPEVLDFYDGKDLSARKQPFVC